MSISIHSAPYGANIFKVGGSKICNYNFVDFLNDLTSRKDANISELFGIQDRGNYLFDVSVTVLKWEEPFLLVTVEGRREK